MQNDALMYGDGVGGGGGGKGTALGSNISPPIFDTSKLCQV